MKEVEELEEAEEVAKAEEQPQSKEPARSLDFTPFDRPGAGRTSGGAPGRAFEDVKWGCHADRPQSSNLSVRPWQDNPLGDSADKWLLFGSRFFLCAAGRAQKIDLEGPGAIDQHARFPFARAEMVHAPGHEPIGAYSHVAQGRGIIGVASTEC